MCEDDEDVFVSLLARSWVNEGLLDFYIDQLDPRAMRL